MKKLLTLVLTILSLSSFGQDKNNYVYFNKFTEVVGTEYVIASIENLGKVFTTNSKYLLFINTKTGDTNQVNFPKDAGIGSIQQIKIDSLNINLILVSGRTVDLDGKSGIDWNDPPQIIILSPDGKTKTQLTDSKFFVRAWTINNMSGTFVVAGHYDTNNNNRYDKKDKDEIHIYDLKTLKLITKI